MQLKIAFASAVGALVASPAGSIAVHNRAFLSNADKLQPEVVAHTFFKMEDEWRSQAQVFVECNTTHETDCAGGRAKGAFEKSCATIINAVDAASAGDRAVVKEYMADVCGQAELQGWRKERCQALASTMTGVMTADNNDNRLRFNVAGVCESYWSGFTAEEAERQKRLRTEEEARRVAREAAEKKLAEERAAAAKKAVEEAAKRAAEEAVRKENERKIEDAKRKEEEAARKVAEAKRKAEEEQKREVEAKKKAAAEAETVRKAAEKEAAELKAKEESAMKNAEEAKRKMEAAKAAADEARKKRAATVAKASPKNVVAPAEHKVAPKEVPVAKATQTMNPTKIVKK